MNPVERAWDWWADLINVSLWDPWLAGAALVGFGLLVFYGLNRLLRP
jgi:hypothetical protein